MTCKDRDGETAGPSDGVPLKDAFDLLRAPRRRWMLDHLLDCDDDVVPLEDVAEGVRSRQRRSGSCDGAGAAQTEIYNELYHAHVPRLSTAGLVDYDASADAVTVEEMPESITTLLEVAREFESPTGEE